MESGKVSMEVPFYFNHGYSCAQVALKCGLKAIYPDEKYGHGDLEELSLHSGKEITFPCQIAYALQRLGKPFRYFVKPERLVELLTGNFDELMRKYYGLAGEQMLLNTNKQSVETSLRALIEDERVVWLNIAPSREMLGDLIEKGCVPISLINSDIFLGRENKFGGHYIPIMGIEDGKLVYHNTGPRNAERNARMRWGKFEDVRDLCFFDYGLVVIVPPIN